MGCKFCIHDLLPCIEPENQTEMQYLPSYGDSDTTQLVPEYHTPNVSDLCVFRPGRQSFIRVIEERIATMSLKRVV